MALRTTFTRTKLDESAEKYQQYIQNAPGEQTGDPFSPETKVKLLQLNRENT